ncbi:MAG: ferredoxin [Patescibacteria group bacterium]
MPKIIHHREKCIGCGTCAAICPEFWEMDEKDFKANLKGGKTDKKTGDQELEMKELACNQEAADACPVQVIEIKL